MSADYNPIALPAEFIAQIQDGMRQQKEIQERLQLMVNTAALVLGIPDGWNFDLQSGSFVKPPEDAADST